MSNVGSISLVAPSPCYIHYVPIPPLKNAKISNCKLLHVQTSSKAHKSGVLAGLHIQLADKQKSHYIFTLTGLILKLPGPPQGQGGDGKGSKQPPAFLGILKNTFVDSVTSDPSTRTFTVTGGHGRWRAEVSAWRGVTVSVEGEGGKEEDAKVWNMSKRGIGERGERSERRGAATLHETPSSFAKAVNDVLIRLLPLALLFAFRFVSSQPWWTPGRRLTPTLRLRLARRRTGPGREGG